LRQIFANNNRQPSLGCGDGTAGLKANGGIDLPFVSLSSRDVISSAAFRLTAFPLCHSSGTRCELFRRSAFPARFPRVSRALLAQSCCAVDKVRGNLWISDT